MSRDVSWPYADFVATLGGAALSGRLTARLIAWADALPPRRRERVQDGTLAIVLALVNVASLLPYHAQIHPFWLALLASAQCVPLTLRRSWPMSMAFALTVPRVAYDLLNLGFAPFPLAPAIGFATVIDRGGRVQRWVVVIIAAGLIVLSQSALATPSRTTRSSSCSPWSPRGPSGR